jgi:hypothetical protein
LMTGSTNNRIIEAAVRDAGNTVAETDHAGWIGLILDEILIHCICNLNCSSAVTFDETPTMEREASVYLMQDHLTSSGLGHPNAIASNTVSERALSNDPVVPANVSIQFTTSVGSGS